MVAAALAALAAVYAGVFIAGAGLLLQENRAAVWTAYHLQEKLRLADEAQRPRILLIGGSATFFGFNATMIEKRTGVDAINLGGHADSGLRFLLHLAETAAEPGDTLVLPIEYTLYRGGDISELSVHASYMMGTDYFLSLPVRLKAQYLRLIDLPGHLAGFRRRYEGDFVPFGRQYWALRMNRNGDMPRVESDAASERRLAEQIATARKTPPQVTLADDAEALTAAFAARMSARNVNVVFTEPPCFEDAAPDGAKLAALERDLADAGARFLRLEADNRMPRRLLYDTALHPNASGRLISTRRLVNALCAARVLPDGADC